MLTTTVRMVEMLLNFLATTLKKVVGYTLLFIISVLLILGTFTYVVLNLAIN